jgi:hypothetical protein
LTAYLNKVKSLSQEVDHHRQSKIECAKDASNFKELIKEDQLYDFLTGISQAFDDSSNAYS